MATFKCDCGNVLSNSHSPNDVVLVTFTDGEWEKIQENVSEGQDIYDIEPKYDVWRCTKCERVYVFNKSSLVLQYKVEQDYRK